MPSPEQIIAMLREMEELTSQGMSVAVAATKLGIILEQENARLKRVADEQARDISILRDLNGWTNLSFTQRRDAVDYLVRHFAMSEDQACSLVGQNGSTQPDDVSNSQERQALDASGKGHDRASENRPQPEGPSPVRRPGVLSDPGRRMISLKDELAQLALDSPVARAVGARALVARVERLIPPTPKRLIRFLLRCPQGDDT